MDISVIRSINPENRQARLSIMITVSAAEEERLANVPLDKMYRNFYDPEDCSPPGEKQTSRKIDLAALLYQDPDRRFLRVGEYVSLEFDTPFVADAFLREMKEGLTRLKRLGEAYGKYLGAQASDYQL